MLLRSITGQLYGLCYRECIDSSHIIAYFTVVFNPNYNILIPVIFRDNFHYMIRQIENFKIRAPYELIHYCYFFYIFSVQSAVRILFHFTSPSQKRKVQSQFHPDVRCCFPKIRQLLNEVIWETSLHHWSHVKELLFSRDMVVAPLKSSTHIRVVSIFCKC